MNYQSPLLQWEVVPDWTECPLANWAKPGIYRFLRDGRVVFIGYAASSKPGLSGRIAPYRRGDVKTHRASQTIAQNKHRLELQVAVIDLPPKRIRGIARELIAKARPVLNEKNTYAGRI
jgi:hypothetical protein